RHGKSGWLVRRRNALPSRRERRSLCIGVTQETSRGGANGDSGIGMGDGLAGQLLAYQANKPILDKLLKEAGFEGDNAISSLLGNLDGAKPAAPHVVPAAAAAPAQAVIAAAPPKE
ncbi:hypothetical protein ACE04B_17960, partial [Rhizobium phaseoli]